MDLIYADSGKKDVGVLLNYKMDLAYGFDENNFELTVSNANHVCGDGYIVYIEGTEYGGIIDAIRVETENKNIVYIGSTWHGLLESKIIEPDAGEDYLVLSGDANDILGILITRLGLSGLFKASEEASGIAVQNYSMHRYVKGYTGIRNMLAAVKAKLKFKFEEGFICLSAEPLVDYSKDEEFDSNQIDFVIEKKFKPTNHMICLGKGDLKERQVLHLYSDADGNISYTQTFFGLDERADVYDNANAESLDELEKGGVKALQDAWNNGKLQIELDGSKQYDIDDIVGAKEYSTGIDVARPIVKKIVTIENNIIEISYKVGE